MYIRAKVLGQIYYPLCTYWGCFTRKRSLVQVQYRPPFPEKTPVLSEDLPIRELLELLLDERARRKMTLRQKSNEELFKLYEDELKLRISRGQLKEYKRVLGHFSTYLGESPPSLQLATSFLAQFSDREPRTLARYLSIIKGFMIWCGEDMPVKVPLPRQLPQYVDPSDVDRLLTAVRNKRTHKETILRDTLLIDTARYSGLRRGELENLEVKD